jgi:hypothetical protein
MLAFAVCGGRWLAHMRAFVVFGGTHAHFCGTWLRNMSFCSCTGAGKTFDV